MGIEESHVIKKKNVGHFCNFKSTILLSHFKNYIPIVYSLTTTLFIITELELHLYDLSYNRILKR